MTRLILAGLASLALAAGAIASPPPGPTTTRHYPPYAPPPVIVVRPPLPAPVTVVPTTATPRYLTPAPVMPVRTYSVYYRSGPWSPWYYYASYRSLWHAEAIGLELEYYLGFEAWVR